MKTFWNWLVTSSTDPDKTSLTIRGILVGIVPTVIWMLPLLCTGVKICIDPNSLPVLVDIAIQIVHYILIAIQAITVVISSVMFIWGMIRKFMNGQWSAAPAPLDPQ